MGLTGQANPSHIPFLETQTLQSKVAAEAEEQRQKALHFSMAGEHILPGLCGFINALTSLL